MYLPGGVPSAHVDRFATDNLPPRELWPVMDYATVPELAAYPARMNAGAMLLDDMVAAGHGARTCLHFNRRKLSYAALLDMANRAARVLTEDYGLKPGNRVLLRAPNNPMLVACWLAVLKAGGICVTTMPLLRARELTTLIDKAEIALALCDVRLADELETARQRAPRLARIGYFTATGEAGDAGADLDARMARKPAGFANVATAADDIALIAFTSGTTGTPKGTMHCHRDVLAICDCFPRSTFGARADDIVCGTPPLAFTFGLGGLAIFPLRFGATATLLENASPAEMVKIIETYKATICFTSPTAYRAMMSAMDKGADLSSLRLAVSAGETLPAPVFAEWVRKTGKMILDGIGSTEMLHIFITNRVGDAVAGTTGHPVSGYEAKVVGDDMKELPVGTPGKLAVRGPTGCRYLADARQSDYARNGWNLTGDTFVSDANGRLSFVARSDDMIVSSGYNIAGPEIEAALLSHPAVAECGVVGAPDEARGMIVKAYVILTPDVTADAALATALQDHVKREIAPYKYPRAIEFVTQLPKTETGKLKRFALRQMAQGGATSAGMAAE